MIIRSVNTLADNLYSVGEVAPLEATFKNAAGVATNTTVVLEVRAPDGTVTTPSPTNTGAGVYHYDQSVTQPGLWWYSFIGTGAVTATEQNSFYAQARYTQTGQYPLANYALVQLEEIREYVLGKAEDDRMDDKLIDRINEMSMAVKSYTRREWLPLVTAATRTFRYRGVNLLSFGACDLRTATAVVAYTDLPTSYQVTLAAGTSNLVADYRFGPTGGLPPASTYRWMAINSQWNTWQPGFFEGFDISITGNWGIGVVPADVKLAVKIAVKNSIENPEGAASRTVGPLTITEEPELLGPETIWRALPGESRALLNPYRDDPMVIAA